MSDLPVALVTGAAAGIGAATVNLLSATHRVYALDVASELPEVFAGNDSVVTMSVDAGDEAQVTAAVARIVEHEQRLDAVVANAGICIIAPADDLDSQAWDDVMSIDLRAVYLLARATLAPLRAGPAGSFVATSSELSLVGDVGLAAYCAAKAGVNGLIRVLALENAKHGVRYNAVAPGPTDTSMMAGFEQASGTQDSASITVPLGRLAHPDEIATVIRFLLSTDASFITGTVVVADGGLTAR